MPDSIVPPASGPASPETPEMPISLPPDASQGLARWNTHPVAVAGLLGGGIGLAGILGAVARLFHDLSDGAFILELYADHRSHTFGTPEAEIVACLFGILGACVLTAISGYGAYIGRPRTIP